MNIFEALRADHERQRDLAERLMSTEGDSDERRDLFGRLKVELEAHARVVVGVVVGRRV